MIWCCKHVCCREWDCGTKKDEESKIEKGGESKKGKGEKGKGDKQKKKADVEKDTLKVHNPTVSVKRTDTKDKKKNKVSPRMENDKSDSSSSKAAQYAAPPTIKRQRSM